MSSYGPDGYPVPEWHNREFEDGVERNRLERLEAKARITEKRRLAKLGITREIELKQACGDW